MGLNGLGSITLNYQIFRCSEGQYHFSAPGALFAPPCPCVPSICQPGRNQPPRRRYPSKPDAPNPLSIDILGLIVVGNILQAS